jgi:two-component system, OmpR family, sensor histidine kinase KdpD
MTDTTDSVLGSADQSSKGGFGPPREPAPGEVEELRAANQALRVALERQQAEVERLRDLDGLKNEFVAMVAHDLRSPMASISGAADTLLSSGDLLGEEHRRSLLEMITRSTGRLAGLVEDVLQVARIESGQFSYDVAPFDLGILVRRTATEAEVGGGGRPRISVDVEAGLPPAQADEERVWQVLMNLLSNALKFSPDDSTVDVAVVAAGPRLRVTITDRGAGIAAEDLPRLFEKFSRIRPAEVHSTGNSTGLGLYICRRIVEAQGGRIWCQSRPGEGSNFVFTVPAAA